MPGLARHSFRSVATRAEMRRGGSGGGPSELPRLLSLTRAPLSVQPALHPGRADAHEGADHVLTSHAVGVTVVQPFGALVLVCTRREGTRTVFVRGTCRVEVKGNRAASHLYTCADHLAGRSQQDTCTRRSRTYSRNGRRTAGNSGSTRLRLKREIVVSSFPPPPGGERVSAL